MADEDGQEHGPAERQADGVHPIGRALRDTYDAENHDSLGSDLTGLMLALARVEPPAVETRPGDRMRQPAPVVPPPRASWWGRLFGR